MENSFKLLLLVATMIHARPLAQTFLEDHPMQLIAQAIDFYNGQSHSDVLFKLLREEYEYKAGPGSRKQIKFTIQETECPKSENRTAESCDYHRDGVEKTCTAVKNEQEKTFSVVCTTMAAGKIPASETLESPRDQEDDYADPADDEYADYEDHVIYVEEGEDDKKLLDEDDGEERRVPASKPQDIRGRLSKSRLRPEQTRGRFYCLECVFDYLPR